MQSDVHKISTPLIQEALPKKRTIYEKVCAICGSGFFTNRKNKNICSFSCKMEHNRQHAKFYVRMKRNPPEMRVAPCEVCGYAETTDRHREGKRIVILCPNHHALISRGKKTLDELLSARS